VKQIVKNINSKKFSFIFKKYVAQSSSYLFNNDFGNDAICGYVYGKHFQIWQNTGIRNLKMLTYGVMHGVIKNDGSLVYYFRKRMDGVIFLLGMSVLSMILGILTYRDLGNIMFVFPFLAVIFFNVFLICWHSKRDRQQLLSVLNRIIYESSNGDDSL
jgi:hypothetical protein